MGRPFRYVVQSEPRADGQLSIVQVERVWKGHDRIILSTGEEVVSRWERLTTQAEWHCQIQSAITVRIWPIQDATELIKFTTTPAPPEGERERCVVPSTGDIGTTIL